MRRSSSVAADLHQKDNKDQYDETIAIDKKTYLIVIFICTLSKSPNHHSPEKMSKALVEETQDVCTIRSCADYDGFSARRPVGVLKQNDKVVLVRKRCRGIPGYIKRAYNAIW